MSRYIEYDAIDYRNDRLHDKSEEFLNGVIYMAQRIEEAPSIDIVRCGECKYARNIEGEWICEHLSGMVGLNVLVKADDFCSYGERMQVMYYPQVDGITPSVIGNSSEKPNNSERSSDA